MTVERWSNEWLKTYKRPSVAEKSYKNYKRHINLICTKIGKYRLDEVRDIHLQQTLNMRQDYSYSEAKHLKDTMQAIFKKARQSRLILIDPAESLEMPKTVRRKRRSLTDNERQHFMLVCDKHPSGLMFKTMLYCGLRPNEIRALQIMDIDFNKAELHVNKGMESGSTVIKEPKTEAGNRIIPIPDILLDDLQAIEGTPFDPAFRQVSTGRLHTESSFYKAWHSVKKAMDLSMGAKTYRNQIILSVIADDLEPYHLRHTCCTDYRDKGIPITVAKEWMGHSSIQVTADIYTHEIDEATRNSYREKLNNSSSQVGEEKMLKTMLK